MFAALGIILLVAGAIITFAIDREAEGFDLHAVGWILMAGGGLALLIALIQGAGWMSARNNVTIGLLDHRKAEGTDRCAFGYGVTVRLGAPEEAIWHTFWIPPLDCRGTFDGS